MMAFIRNGEARFSFFADWNKIVQGNVIFRVFSTGVYVPAIYAKP
jgi:hypothetical protein